MPEQKPFSEDQRKLPLQPPHKVHDVPPHILKELFRMSEKIGKLEGMVEVLLQQKKCQCGHDT